MMQRGRAGFSLMEVMLATSILLGSSIVLIELANIGRKQANSAYNLNTAQLLCEAKLDEIVAGVTAIKVVSDEELEDNPGWRFSVETHPLRDRHLLAVRVTVFQEPEEFKRVVRFSLVRWLPEQLPKSPDGISTEEPTVSPQRGTSREGRP
jgi:hypothetical protein